MRFLISAGPTHEPIDAVRYIANRSSGTLGIALAREARRRGHEVTLVLGPTHLQAPDGIRLLPVVTAAEMLAALSSGFAQCDVLIMAAAVADVRPRAVAQRKLKKEELGDALPLEKNADILAELSKMRTTQIVVGFSLETLLGAEAIAEAARKATAKRCDLMVLNSAGSLGGADAVAVVLVQADGTSELLGDITKQSLAEKLLTWCELAGRNKR